MRREVTHPDEVIKLLQTEAEDSTEDCPNGEHCGEQFEEIDESELIAHLNSGYTLVHTLQNGRVIVKRSVA